MTERLTEKIMVSKDGEILGYRIKPFHERQATQKLAEYETAEEEGRLIMLPCKIGSAVYLICHRYTECSKYGESFEEYSCSGCEEWDCDSRKEYYIHINQSVSLEWIVRNMRMENFGKTVFLTMEEAEKALKEMEKDE